MNDDLKQAQDREDRARMEVAIANSHLAMATNSRRRTEEEERAGAIANRRAAIAKGNLRHEEEAEENTSSKYIRTY